ncbi:MAG: biotin/lipoyl-containing protein [bacterium]
MKEERIRELNTLMNKMGILELEVKDGDFECKIKKLSLSPLPAIQEEEKNLPIVIKSPTVGIFYPKVEENNIVSSSQAIGTIMVVGHPHEVVSPQDGKVIQVLVKEGFPVEYGQPLVLIS